MTAVNWMIEKLLERHSGTLGNEYVKIFEQAKNMEQGEICLAFLEGQHHSDKLPSQYYIETYGSKGSDEHIIDTNEMISSQTEISDEEIEKDAFYLEPQVTRRAFISGAKWYREQLKTKI